MVTLEQAKNYLRIDVDVTADDELVQSLIEAATAYIVDTTGKKDKDGDTYSTYNTCTLMLVSHWYETRAITEGRPGTLTEVPHTVTALLMHIANSGAYPEADGND